MKRINRSSYVTAVNFLMLGIFLAGCIVVVKEDDDRRRRYLQGSEWTLEVVFYRTQTVVSADRTIQVDFASDNTVTGLAACGAFSGQYEVNENGGITISSIETPSSCQDSAEVELVTNSLRSATSYSATERDLTITTAEDGYLAFAAK